MMRLFESLTAAWKRGALPDALPQTLAEESPSSPRAVTHDRASDYVDSLWPDLRKGDFAGCFALRQGVFDIPVAGGGAVRVAIPKPTVLSTTPRINNQPGVALRVRNELRAQWLPTYAPDIGPGGCLFNQISRHVGLSVKDVYVARGEPGDENVELISADVKLQRNAGTYSVPWGNLPYRLNRTQQGNWNHLTQAFTQQISNLFVGALQPHVLNLVNLMDLESTAFTLRWTGGEAVQWERPAPDAGRVRENMVLTPCYTHVELGRARTRDRGGEHEYGIKFEHTLNIREGRGADQRVTLKAKCFVAARGQPMQPRADVPVRPPVPPPRDGSYLVKLLQQVFATGEAADATHPVRLSLRGWVDIASLVPAYTELPALVSQWRLGCDGQALRVSRTGPDNLLTVTADRPIVLSPSPRTTGLAFLQRPIFRALDRWLAARLVVEVSSLTFSRDGRSASIDARLRVGWFSMHLGRRSVPLPDLTEFAALADLEALGESIRSVAFEPYIPAFVSMLGPNTNFFVNAGRSNRLRLNSAQEMVAESTKIQVRGKKRVCLEASYEHRVHIHTGDEKRPARAEFSVTTAPAR